MKGIEALAYAAGYVDGEGSFTIAKVSAGAPSSVKAGRVSPIYVARVCAVNTNRSTLDWFALMFGGHVQMGPKRRSALHKQGWEWRSSGYGAYEFAKAVLPYLKQKSAQAQLLVKFWDEIGGYPRGAKLTLPELATRQWYYLEMRRLNEKGVKEARPSKE